MRFVGYVRVSTHCQAETGISLSEQITTMTAWAGLHGHELVAIHEDRGLSGKNLLRPGLHRALKALKAGEAEALVVSCLDRLSRSVLDVCRLIDSHFGPGAYGLAAVREDLNTTTPVGRAIIGILSVMAQWQREQMVEKVRNALAEKQRRGELTGSVPWGYYLGRDGKTLRASVRERRMMAYALELRRAGLSYQKIGNRLRERKLTNRRGSYIWHPPSVKGLVVAAEQALTKKILVERVDGTILPADDAVTADQLHVASPEGTAERAGVPLVSSDEQPPKEVAEFGGLIPGGVLAQLRACGLEIVVKDEEAFSAKKEEVGP